MHHVHGNANFSRKSNDTKQGIILGACGVVSFFTAFVATLIPEDILVLYNASILIIFGFVIIIWRTYSNGGVSLFKTTIIGVIASFNKAITGGNYRPTIIAFSTLLGTSIKKTIAIVSLAGSIVCIFAIVGYVLGGATPSLDLTFCITIGACFSALLSVFFIKRTPTSKLRVLIGIAMIVLGLCLLPRSI